jgi:hypothetical protein
MTSVLGKRVSQPSARVRAAREQEDDESEDDAQHAQVELVLPPDDFDSSDDENEHPLEQQVDAPNEEDVAPVVQKKGETKLAAAKRAKDEENARWSPNLVAFGAPAFKGPKVGPTAPRKQRDTALKCWKLFFTETLLTAICEFTNEYGQSKFSEKPLGTTELSVFLCRQFHLPSIDGSRCQSVKKRLYGVRKFGRQRQEIQIEVRKARTSSVQNKYA